MPRKPRCYVPNVPCHVITRGNDRQACFFKNGDYEFYLECLSDACNRYNVSLHAYVLMTNHVHLLMTPESEVIEEEAYLLACYRYIELNPVRANMVTHPLEYPWTSYFENSGAKQQTITVPHAIYNRLGLDKASRQTAYKELFDLQLAPTLLNEIRRASECSMPIGSADFQHQIEDVVGRKLGYAKRGRPHLKCE